MFADVSVYHFYNHLELGNGYSSKILCFFCRRCDEASVCFGEGFAAVADRGEHRRRRCVDEEEKEKENTAAAARHNDVAAARRYCQTFTERTFFVDYC